MNTRKKPSAARALIVALVMLACQFPPLADAQVKFTGSGTGFFISASGLMLTAEHVVRGQERIAILYGGKLVKAEVLKTDPQNDLALLKVERTPVPFLRLGRSDNIPVGLEIFAIGYPLINIQGVSPKFTAGIINSNAGLRGSSRHFQFSAEIQKGNSGGPLLGADGLVVGVVVSKLGTITTSDKTIDIPQNVNYALKSDWTGDLLKEIDEVPAALSINPKSDKKPFEIYRDSALAVVPVLVARPDNTPAQELPAKNDLLR